MSNVAIRHGSEGPHHDPYSYDEITVTRTSPHFSGSVTIHRGLAEWMEAHPAGRQESYRYRSYDRNGGYNRLQELFRLLAGVTPEQAEAAHYAGIRRRIDACVKQHHDVRDAQGYPGESFIWCHTCQRQLDYHFDESAVI